MRSSYANNLITHSPTTQFINKLSDSNNFLIVLFSLLTGEIQLLAFLLVGAIHIYINVMQLPMVKRYFK